MAQAQQQLAEALPHLLSADAAMRQAAEQAIERLKTEPSTFFPSLMSLARSFPEPQMRQMAAVIFRKSLAKDVWAAAGEQAHQTVKAGLLEAVVPETQHLVRKSLADVISKMAAVNSQVGAWPEVLPFVFNCCREQDDSIREIGLCLVVSLSEEVGEDAVLPFLEHMQPIFKAGLENTNSMGVRLASFKAIASCVPFVSGTKHRAQQQLLQQAIPQMFQVLDDSLTSGIEHAKTCFTCLNDIVLMDAGFFRPEIEKLLQTALNLAGNRRVDQCIRHLALELAVTYSEGKPALARKTPQLVEKFLPLAISMIESVDQDGDWDENIGDDEDADETEDSVRFGEEALERFMFAMGGNRMVPATLPLVAQKLQSPNWQERYASLRSVALLASSADKYLSKHLAEVVSMVASFLGDSNVRVTWAAAGAIAALCTCFGPTVQQNHHQQILPALVALLGPAAHPRLRSRSARCIVDFTAECEDEDAEMLQAYSDSIVESLTAILVSGHVGQQKAAITAVSSLAASLDEHFLKYYAHLMPGLVGILSTAASSGGRAGRELIGPAMECVSCIADAVGTEHFGKDAPAVMELLMALQQQSLEGDDSHMSYLLQASSRIAKCMGPAFVPFLPRLLPSIIGFAQLDPKLDMEQAESNDNGDEEYSVVTIKGMGKMRVSINVKELEEKAMGCQVLSSYAEALKEHFLPHVDMVSQILVPAMTYKLSEGVRTASIEAAPELLKVVKSAIEKGTASQQALGQLWSMIWPQLMQASIVEPDSDAQRVVLDSISECIEICGQGCLNEEQAEQLIQVMKPLLEDHIKGSAAEGEKEDEDEVEDDGVMMALMEVLAAALKTHGAPFVTRMQALLPLYGQLLGAERSSEDKCAALNTLIEVVEYGADVAKPLVSNIAAACLQYSSSEDPAVLRSACYGLGVCAEKGGDVFAPIAAQALQQLHSVVQAPGARDGDYKEAAENAVDSVGKVCKFQAGAVDTSSVLPVWVSWLPLQHDAECAATSHAMMTDLVESQHPSVMQQLPKVLSTLPLLLAADKNLASEQTRERLRAGLQRIPAAELQAAAAAASLDLATLAQYGVVGA